MGDKGDKIKNASHWWIIGVIAASLVILWPLTRPGFYISDDGEWMVIRLSAFFQTLREGQFPVRFLGRLNDGYGYPVANFLYPGFLYLGSFIHALGFSFIDSVKIILAGSVVGASVFVFLWLRQRFGNLASFVGTLSFAFSPYLLFDLYRRGSVGEVLAMLPAAILFWLMASGQWWLIAPAVGFLIISHNSLALIFLAVFGAWALFEQRREYLWQMLLGVGQASFFWLPAIFERQFVRFDEVVVSHPAEYFVSGEKWYLVGSVTLFAFVATLFSRKREAEINRVLIIFAAAILLATPVSSAWWEGGLLPKLIQFPYRFLAVTSLVGSLLVAYLLERVGKLPWILTTLVVAILVVQAMPTLSTINFVDRPETYYTTNEGTTTVADEYLPRWVREKPKGRAGVRTEFAKGGGTISPRKLTSQTIDLDITASVDSVLAINTIYYPGWGALLDGELTLIDYDDPRGIMRVAVPAGQHRLYMSFRETPPRLGADMISLGSFIAYAVLVLRNIKNFRGAGSRSAGQKSKREIT